MGCMGQIRMAPMGGPTGLDMGAVIAVARMRGWESPELLDLLSAAEEGIWTAYAKED